jgi:hypothetical protein
LQELLAKVKPKDRKYFNELRTALRAFPNTQETVEIDEVSGEWCPVYRVNGSDLVWVHFDEHLWVSFPVEPNFEKKVLQGVKEAEETSGEKWATIEIKMAGRVDSVLQLLKLRHSMLSG